MYQRRNRKAIVYIPKKIRYFDCIPEELVFTILSFCPFSSLSVCRQFFGIARQVIVKSLLDIPEPMRQNGLKWGYDGGEYADLLEKMKSVHSLWYIGQFIGLSLSCLNDPMENEKEQFLQKLALYNDGMGLYYQNLPCRDNINLFNLLTDNTTNATLIANEYLVAYRILSFPLITRERRQTLIKIMAAHGHQFRMFDYQYRPLPRRLLDDIIAEPNSRFCFFLSIEFEDEHFELVKEMYTKKKITGRDVKLNTVYNKDLLVASRLVNRWDTQSDSDYDYSCGLDEYEDDVMDRYDNVIVNEDACCFMDWARGLED